MVCVFGTPDESGASKPKFGMCWCCCREILFSVFAGMKLRVRRGLRAVVLRVRGLGSSAFAESKLGKLKARFSAYFSNFKPSYLSHFKSKLSDSKAKIQGFFMGDLVVNSEF